MTRSGRLKKQTATGKSPDYKLILSMFYKKLHVRGVAGAKSPCGRATAFQLGFEIHVVVPDSAKSHCKHCFGDATVGSLKVVA